MAKKTANKKKWLPFKVRFKIHLDLSVTPRKFRRALVVCVPVAALLATALGGPEFRVFF